MENSREMLPDFLQGLYGVSGIPAEVWYRSASGDWSLRTTVPKAGFLTELFLVSAHDYFLLEPRTVVAYVDEYDLFWGSVFRPDTEELVVLGPCTTVELDETQIRTITKRIGSLDTRKSIQEKLRTIPHRKPEQLLNALNIVHLYWLGYSLPLTEMFGVNSTVQTDGIQALQLNASFSDRDYYDSHNTYDYEMQYLSYVRRGDPEGLSRFFDHHPPDIFVGQMANTPLRQMKNIFISAATTATRTAVEGGMPAAEAYDLGYIYMYQMEGLTSSDQVYQLQYKMIFDFAERVRTFRVPESAGPVVDAACRYIASKVNAPLSVQEVADFLGVSRTYLSLVFSREMGISASEYIMQRKLQEGRNLLEYSDRPVGDISAYLGFSSQSYFQNVFKKNFGMTPNQYRRKNRKPGI